MTRFLYLLLGRGMVADEDREAAYYLRVTRIVGISMVIGALLEWVPASPHPLRHPAFAAAYLIGGWKILLDSWAELTTGSMKRLTLLQSGRDIPRSTCGRYAAAAGAGAGSSSHAG